MYASIVHKTQDVKTGDLAFRNKVRCGTNIKVRCGTNIKVRCGTTIPQ